MASTTCGAAAQDIAARYRIPEPLSIAVEASHPTLAPVVLPIGWSRDGFFAWVEVEWVGGRGGADVTYMIIDTVEDLVVWRLRDAVSWERARRDGSDRSIVEYSWNDFGSEYIPQLERFGIEQRDQPESGSFPLFDLGVMITAAIETEFPDGGRGGASDHLDSYSVIVNSMRRGKKRVTTNSRTDALDAWIVGYVESPFEPRIAVAVATEHTGREGPPNRVRVRFYGCHLRVGFGLEEPVE